MTSPDLTPNDVHDVAFSKSITRSRGYAEHQVDAFLDRAEKDLAAGLPLGDAVSSARFTKPPLGKRGCDEDQVDAFLDRLAATDPGHVAGPARLAIAGPAVSGEPFVESPGLLARLFRRR